MRQLCTTVYLAAFVAAISAHDTANAPGGPFGGNYNFPQAGTKGVGGGLDEAIQPQALSVPHKRANPAV